MKDKRKKEVKFGQKPIFILLAGSNYLIWIMSFKEINY